MAGITERETAIRAKLRDDFEFYAPRCLQIATKPDEGGMSLIVPFKLNEAQRYIHGRIEAQKAEVGYVRAMILKGRQQGASTYVEGRFYWKTTQNRGQKTYILTHKQEATDNLFAMVDRYHTNAPPFVRPQVGRANAKELVFPGLDSRYQVATAGAKGAGRSSTLINVHGSEVGFWENGKSHLEGMLQAVPLAPGTEVILESTANGVGGVFHAQWQLAEAGLSDFIAIFVPWFWQLEYRRKLPDGFQINDDRESVPEGELTELEYKRAHKLDDQQIYWRRRKIIELGDGQEGYYSFKQEYPATSDEAFQSASVHSLISRRSVLKARKNDVATAGRLIIGVDPAGDGEDGDATGIIRRRTRKLFNPQRLKGLNTMQIAALVHRIIKSEKPARVFIDVGGIGKGIIDRLNEMEGTQGIVAPVNFGESALDPETFVNRRVEMWHLMRDWLDDPGGANIPDDDAFQAELLSVVPDDPDSNQRKRLKSKKWMRSKGIKSPDLGDAAALTFALPIDAGIDFGTGNSSTDFDPLNGEIYESGQIGSAFDDFDPF